MQPLVSILIPAFNSQEWIADTLRSAIGQTWQPAEIIVVDDGSTDDTLRIARRFESRSVRIVSQENQGAAAARNTAYAFSHGDYIQWLDSDDLLAPDKIARQMEVAEQFQSKRILLSAAWGRFMYRWHRARFSPNPLWCDLSPAEFLVRKMGQNLYMPVHAWLVSRDLTEAAGPWDTSMLRDDDGEYFCRVLVASDGARFVPDAKVYYRHSGASSQSYIGRSGEKLEAEWRSIQSHIAYLRSLEDTEKTRAASVRFLQNWLSCFYPEKPDIVKQAKKMAIELGGQLETPRLSWKYSWLKALFGWAFAKRAQLLLTNARWALERLSDKMLSRIRGTRTGLFANDGRG